MLFSLYLCICVWKLYTLYEYQTSEEEDNRVNFYSNAHNTAVQEGKSNTDGLHTLYYKKTVFVACNEGFKAALVHAITMTR